MTNTLVRHVAGADLRLGYTGLSKKVPLSKLGKGEFVAFVNNRLDKVKLCTCNDLVCYLRLPPGQKIDPNVITHLPEFFDGKSINYDAAVEKSLRKSFPKWFEGKN